MARTAAARALAAIILNCGHRAELGINNSDGA